MCIGNNLLHFISIQLAKVSVVNICKISVLASVSIRVWHLQLQQELTVDNATM